MQCPPTCTPSINNAARSRSSSDVARQASNCAWVCVTKRRLTALLLVPRARTSAPSGSRLRSYWRVATPTSICSTTRRLSGPASANAWTVGRTSSWPSRRTRGRRIATLRPPSTTWLGECPARYAPRSGWCAYRGPQTATRSSSNIASSTFKPEATTSCWSSACVSTRMSTNGRCRCPEDFGWRRPAAVRDCFFMAAPFWGRCPRLSHRPYNTTRREPPPQNFNS